MRFIIHSLRRLEKHPMLAVAIGCSFLMVSGLLLLAHARSIHHVKDTSVPLISQIPVLQRRLDVLTKQAETADLHAALRMGSQEERINVFVLPEEPDFDRVLTALDLLTDRLQKEGLLSEVSAIEVGDRHEGGVPMSLSMTVRSEGMRKTLLFLKLAGVISINDALTTDERDSLLAVTETENPAGITSMEQFLSTDLLQYLLRPRLYEDQLHRSFTSDAFLSSYKQILEDSLVGRSSDLLSNSLGERMEDRNLWPMQFVSVEEVELVRGSARDWYDLTLQLNLHGVEAH